MAKYTGPTCKLSRREGTDLFLKSRVRSLDSKCNLEKVPGQTTDRRRAFQTTGCSCGKSRKYAVPTGFWKSSFVTTTRRRPGKGATGENLLQLLECRLDNVVYRMGFGTTRAEARQLVTTRQSRSTVKRPAYRPIRSGGRPGQRAGESTQADPNCRCAVAGRAVWFFGLG